MAISDAWRAGGWKTGWLDFRRKRFWVWVAIALYTLLGFVVVPWIARGVIVDQIRAQLGLTATLDDVDVNPYALSVRLKGFSLNERSGRQMIAFDEAEANLQLSSIVNRAWTFSEIRIVHPYVRVEHDAEAGTLNLLQLVPPRNPQAKPEPASAPPRLIVAAASIEGGRASVADRTARQTYETDLGPVDLRVTGISTLPNARGEETLAVETLFGGRLEWKGDLTLVPFSSTGRVSFTGEQLAPFTAYLPPQLKMTIDNGTLDVAFDYSVAESGSGISLDVSNIGMKLAKLGIAQTADAAPAELLGLGEFVVDGGRLQWPDKRFTAQRIALDAPTVALSRDAEQHFIWQRLWQGEAAPPPVAVPPSSAQTATAPTAAPTTLPWTVEVARFEIAQGRVGFADQSVDPAANLGISDLATSVEGLTLADGASMPFTIKFNVDGGGNVALNGTVAARPDFRLDAQMKVGDLALTTINPYLNAQTYLRIASGGVGVDGHLVSTPEDALSFDGELGLADLDVLRDDTDGRLMGLKTLSIKGVTMSLAGRRVDLARVELDHAYARIHISKDRVVNFATLSRSTVAAAEGEQGGAATQPAAARQVTAPTAVAASTGSSSETPWIIKLGRLKVSDADVDFSDDSLPIPFSRSISKLSGGIDAFDTSSSAPTRLNLTGQVGEYGSLKVSGTVRVLEPLQQTNITASFKNLDMPGASAYAIRFAGRKVASGKLDMDMHYTLSHGVLEGNHKIVVHDFQLGEKVPYPEALNLPYDLAVSLLKDSSGNIKVDLPIEGDVNDPTFRIGGVIMRALGNLITQMVTSPFRLLGRLVGWGDSEGFDQVLFEPGSAQLAPPEREKVAKIAEALTLRPSLALTVHGVSNQLADTQALRSASVRARLDERVGDLDAEGRLKVIETMVNESIPGLSLDSIKAQYSAPPEPDAKPVLDEGAYVNALIEKLVAAEPLPPDAVATLAAARATAVRSAFAEASLDMTRIAIGDPQEVSLQDDEIPLKFELAAH